MVKRILQSVLKILAKIILWRHNPVIVAITGSVGKTSAKAAIAAVLRRKFFVWESSGNYNNEIGIPVTILGAKSGGKNPLVWIWIGLKFWYLLIFPKYPKVLILEMAADRLGDISYLTKIARPNIAVVTKVSESHSEFLGDLTSIQKEKSQIISALPDEGIAILNADDQRVAAMKNLHQGKTLFYGLSENAECRGSEIIIRQNPDANLVDPKQSIGLKFLLESNHKNYKVFVPGLLGRPSVYALLSAFAVGINFGVEPESIIESFSDFDSPPGRLNLLAGIKNTIIIDDSYNSSPEAVAESLNALKQLRGKRRVAVLGDMLELGEVTEKAHRRIGRAVRDLNLDFLFTVGARAKFISDEARKSGFAKSRIKEFDSVEQALAPAQNKMQEGDVILVKGSQGIRLEKFVKEIMAEPERSADLLCRQDAKWLKQG